ncbi:MAG TPA: alpha/beta hydrolase [Streptosporangiaceae bacterium]
MITENDLELTDGSTLHTYDTGADGPADGLVVFWHHGTPNLGSPPKPLFAAAGRFGIRWVSYDRPGYGSSTPAPGRDIASAASYTAQVADALGIGRFATMGHSGGAPHALACGALLPDRVLAVVSVSSPAPFGAEALDWFAGMSAGSAASLRAASLGRAAKEKHEASAEWDPATFTAADRAALEGSWAWFEEVVSPAIEAGPAALIDDDLANVAPWGFDPAQMAVPVLFMHGEQDRMLPCSQSQWLAAHTPGSQLRLCSGDGHISVLNSAEQALDWLSQKAG